MSLPKALTDREYNKFKETPAGETSVRVCVDNTDDFPSGGQDLSVFIPAGETISAVKAVYEENSELFLGDPMLFTKSNIIGISQTGATIGNQVRIIEKGRFFDSSFSFVLGEPVFLASSGGITQVEPISGFRVLLGYAIAENGFNINIQEPIEI